MCKNMLFRFLPELQALSLAFQALYITQNLFGTSYVFARLKFPVKKLTTSITT